MNLRYAGITMLTLAVLLAAGCASDDDGAPANAQQRTVTFGDALTFDPSALTVQAGRPVLLTLKSTGNTDHDFVIRSMPVRDVKNQVKGGHGHGDAGTVAGHPKTGREVTIRFTPTTAGSYEFWCSITGHREAGMTGTLMVTSVGA